MSSSATKKNVEPFLVRSLGLLSPLGLISLTMTVPASVPSVFQSSLPPLSPMAAKKWISGFGASAGVSGSCVGVSGSGAGVSGSSTGVSGSSTGVSGSSVGVSGSSTGVSGVSGLSGWSTETLESSSEIPGRFFLCASEPPPHAVSIKAIQERVIMAIVLFIMGTAFYFKTQPSPEGLISLSITVPASVPSLFQSSLPWMPSSAIK